MILVFAFVLVATLLTGVHQIRALGRAVDELRRSAVALRAEDPEPTGSRR